MGVIFSEKLKTKEITITCEEISEKFSSAELIDNLYFLCINLESKALMDIISMENLMKGYYDAIRYYCIGVATGEKNAFELSKEMIEEFYTERKTLDFFQQLTVRNLT